MNNLNIHKRDYNFFSSVINSKRSARKRNLLLISFILLYLALLLGVYFLLEYRIKSTQSQIDTIRRYLSTEEVSTQRKLALDKKQQIESLKLYSESLDSFLLDIQKNDIIGTEYINQIISVIPQGLYFDNLSMTSYHLQIQGTAKSRQIVADFLNNIQALDIFKDVHISNITTILKNDNMSPETSSEGIVSGYSFIMDCQLKDVKE